MVTEATQATIADYLGDMIAVESHIEEALDRQLDLAKKSPVAAPAIQRFHDMVKQNRDTLRAYQEEIGSTAGNPIAEAGSAILGKAAGMIDKVRTDTVSKALRDDYTAFNLAAISYTMLQTTALAVNDKKTAELAAKGLKGYASAVQEINHLIPAVVVEELQAENRIPDASPGVVAEVRASLDKIWKETSN
jgi:ferritin-like metal-binding protein YciE